MAKDPNQVASKWAQNLSSAGPSITAGVQNVSTAPGQAAARQEGAYVQGVQAAVSKWKAAVAAVSLTDWQQATLNKGVPRIAQGATAAQPKMAQFMGKLLPFIETQRGTLQPRGTLDQNIARMTDWARKMSTFKK